MRNKTLALFVVLALAVSVCLGAVNGVFNHVKAADYAIGSNVVIPAGVTGYTGTGLVALSDSPALTGVPTVPTAAPGTNTTQAASTAFVQAAITGGGIGRTCNANGCYVTLSDGTVEEWGTTGTASGGGAATVTGTYPFALTAVDVAPVATFQGTPNGDGNPHPATCHVTSFSTSGITAIAALAVQVGGSGYSSLNSNYCSYHLIGH